MRKLDSSDMNFTCSKCRGKKAVLNKVSLSRLSGSQILPLKRGKYIFLTCALCGYTEVYDLALYAKSEEFEEKKIEQPQEA